MQSQLLQNMSAVRLHSRQTDAERSGDLLIGGFRSGDSSAFSGPPLDRDNLCPPAPSVVKPPLP